VNDIDGEERRLRSVAMQNAQSILLARQRSEDELVRAKEALRESNEHLLLVLAAGSLGAWTWDAATDEVSLSARTAEIFGLPEEPVTWTRMRELLHEEDRERARVAVEVALEQHTDYDIEYRVCRPSRDEIWVAARGRGRYASDGSIRGMTGVVQDVTERKRAEESLRDETRTLKLLHDTGRAIASQIDLQTVVQTVTDSATQLCGAQFGAFFYNVVNPAGESFLLYTLSGAPREAFESMGLPRNTDVFDPTFRGAGTLRSDDITRDERYGHMGPHFGMPKGHLPVRSYLAVSVRSRSGAVIGGLFFGHSDVGVFTARAERLVEGIAAQAEIAIDNAQLYESARQAAVQRDVLLESERSARSALERMNNVKDEFLATLSHELRTPLNAILGWAQVLKMGTPSDADLQSGLDTIERNARMQTQLIEDLLDMSRITSGKVRLDVQLVEPMSFVDAAIEAVRPGAEAKGMRIERTLDPRAGPIWGDPHRLQQVVWNLLSNAIKFTPRGGRIGVVLARVDSHVELRVADNGIGIKPELMPHLFERFRQGDGSTTRLHGGLGLGLSIVKHLVELHGGTVHAESRGAGAGATFLVQLPVTALQSGTSRDAGFHPSATGFHSVPFAPIDLSHTLVLVVDDELDARDIIRRVLSECHAEVLIASSADEALGILERERPHVIVSDIGMPGVDGYELLRRVRSLGADRGGAVPAIALTAFARSEDRVRALRAGFQVHVAKPVQPSELVATVASVLGRATGSL
jgi:PAS domain S-box-containing protein